MSSFLNITDDATDSDITQNLCGLRTVNIGGTQFHKAYIRIGSTPNGTGIYIEATGIGELDALNNMIDQVQSMAAQVSYAISETVGPIKARIRRELASDAVKDAALPTIPKPKEFS